MEALRTRLQNAPASKIAIIGFPFEGNSSYMAGTALAPPLIREALFCESSNMWTENGTDLGADSVLFDAGDLVNHIYENAEHAISLVLQHSLIPISLGGDHSLTFPILKAFRKNFPRLTVLHFDAHPDLYHDFDSNPHSHASPFARIMESGLAGRLVQVGIRTANRHQREQAQKFHVEMIEMQNLNQARDLQFDSPVYVSFDMDGLDPAFAPGVAHPEPGGLSTRQAVEVIQRINTEVVGADIVEFNPKRDSNGITAFVCAKIFKEIAGKILED